MTKRLVLFNHKGGVSKTTTVYNVGWMLAEQGHRVLLVDADPQCNLSSLILGDDFDEYYLDDATRLQNIKDGVAPAFTGKPTPIQPVICKSPDRQPRVQLLAGHATLSEYDASLTFAQNSNALATLQNLPGAFHELIRQVEEANDIDYTIIDLNPGLSAINQNLFLNSDFFLIPTNPDPFSIMALQTLESIFPRWATWKTGNEGVFRDSAYPLRPGLPKFVGTVIQRFNVRKGRAAAPYRDNIADIKDITQHRLYAALRNAGLTLPDNEYPEALRNNGFCLEEIPDFGGLLPRSHEAGVPVFALHDDELNATGVVLANSQDKRSQIHAQLSTVAQTLQDLMH
ncbi:ParA family protein [Uliginosibacterium aquaticum]|uniref:ParA family protein n=1 Tax=Uliginosibacterium aquaticum TaxID=2731212 RepID=A0ABX2IAZ6_9RHOO|nr:ParA family protein [Uliginosibacterium aquaticum]NSL53551.1 ParA family protein [Uliginosibacterium aquaticum]